MSIGLFSICDGATFEKPLTAENSVCVCDCVGQVHTRTDGTRRQLANRQTERRTGRQSHASCHQTSGLFSHQLTELIGQFLHDYAEALQFLEHADQVLTGKATDHLQVFTGTKPDRSVRPKLSCSSQNTRLSRSMCLPLVLCPVYSVLMAEEPLRFSRIIVSLVTAEKKGRIKTVFGIKYIHLTPQAKLNRIEFYLIF